MATQKIHFFTGKGGVGKSVLAAGFAYQLAEKSGPILLAELSERSFYSDFFKNKSETQNRTQNSNQNISYKPSLIKDLKENLFFAQWSPTDCLKEYALHLLKIESLYKLFFENQVSKSLINVAPGLQETAILGKATSAARKHGPQMEFSEIVIDSFSTGHFLSLFRAPQAMSEIISFGPMSEQSRGIDQSLRNHEYCKVHVVTLPEDLPITEAIELNQQLRNEFGIQPQVYLNKLHNLNDADLKNLKSDLKNYFSEILENEKISKDRLTSAGISFLEIDFQTELNSIILIKNIAKLMIHQLNELND